MLHDWIMLCCEARVAKRALKYAVVVGAILIAINHGEAILQGDLGPARLLRMGLTVIVPYMVSALSSAGAIRAYERTQR